MTNKIAYSGKQTLSVFKGNQIKVPLAKVGKWKHPSYGEVAFTKKDLEQLSNNYKSNSVGFTPYATFGHLDEEHHSTDSARKRGDMSDIILENDVAYGVFDVNDSVYKSVLDGEYEYASGEFNRNFMDKEGNKVGTTLLRVALTNSPFIPFGDTKIEALSANKENCLENGLNSMFLLSIESPEKTELNKEISEDIQETLESELEKVPEINEEELSASIAQKVVDNLTTTFNSKDNLNNKPEEQAILKKTNTYNTMPEQKANVAQDPNLESAKEAVLGEVKKPESVEEVRPVEEVKQEPEVKEVKEDTSKYDALMSKLESIETNYTNKLMEVQKASQDIISQLTSKLEEATAKLANQEVVTQQFSASVSKAQEEALIQNLQNSGVQPPVLQKFLAFKEAYNKSEDGIVKFSVGSGDEAKVIEKTVIDSIADMIISASRQTSVVEQQLGITSGSKLGNFSSIIERNRELAQKQSI